MTKYFTLAKLMTAFAFTLLWLMPSAQDLSKSSTPLLLVKKNAAAIGLSEENIRNSRITDSYLDPLSGNTLVYLQQTYQALI